MTQCCVEALYKLGRSYQPSVDLAKTFERRRCNHREAVAPDECVKDVIGTSILCHPILPSPTIDAPDLYRPRLMMIYPGPTNKHRYILASQSPSLRQTLQSVPGLPIIHFNPRGVLVLSPPSRATLKHKDELEKERRMEGGKVEVVDDGGNVVGEATSGGSGAGKRGRVKGPNPMSVRKKKAVVQGGEKAGQEGAGKRKKRGRDGQDDAAVEGGKEGEREGGDDTGKRNRKRKRRGTGGVTQATAEPGEVATISERE